MLSSCFSFPLDATAIYNDIKKSRDPRSGILQIDGFWHNFFSIHFEDFKWTSSKLKAIIPPHFAPLLNIIVYSYEKSGPFRMPSSE